MNLFLPHRKRTSRFCFLPRRQRGYLLIMLLLALPIIGGIGLWFISQQTRAAQVARNVAEGSQAAQFAVGLRGYMAVVQQNPALLSASNDGVDWLKPVSCGGVGLGGTRKLPTGEEIPWWPVEGFVPCSYTGGSLGHLYRTTVTRNGATNQVEARTTFIVPPFNADPATAILSAEQIVQGALANQSVPANGIFFTAFANSSITANQPEAPTSIQPANAGRVLMVATNAPSNDLWLRTDGTNMMQANLNMGDHSIENAHSARFRGDVLVQNRLHVEQGVSSNEFYISSINKFLSEGVYYAETFIGQQPGIPKPDCSQAGNNPAVYVGIQSLGQLPDADTVLWTGSVDVADAGSTWTATPRLQGVKFDLEWDGSIYTLKKTAVTASNPSGFRYMVMTRCR